MTDVETLAQLLRNATAGDGTADWSGYVAEYLLAHGVSVSEPRLPSWVYPLWDAALNVVATSEACHPMARGASALEVAVRELKAAIEIAPCGAEVEAASRARSVRGGETTR